MHLSFYLMIQNIFGLKKSKFVNPEALEKNLKQQKIIGEIGEMIALDFETNRLKINGFENIEKLTEHTAKINSASGFDIRTSAKTDNRYIEVKSSTIKNSEFYITENEYQTLKELKKEAFIYFVHVENIQQQSGNVYKIIKNPIEYLENEAKLKPVVYKVNITKKHPTTKNCAYKTNKI